MKSSLFFLGLLIIFSSCTNDAEKKYTNKNIEVIESTKLKEEKKSLLNQKEKSEKVDDTLYSFVLSCGSGCALTYNLKNSQFLDKEKLSIKFSVTMWIDEQVTDESLDSYIIEFREENVQNIYSADEKDYLTEEESPNLFKEIQKIGKILYRRQQVKS